MKFKMKKYYRESYKVNTLEKGQVYSDNQLLGGVAKAKSLIASGYAIEVDDKANIAPLQANPILAQEAKKIKEALAKRPDILAEALDEATMPTDKPVRKTRVKTDG